MAAGALGTATAAIPTYLDETAPVEARVEDALSRMTLREKVNMLHAQSKFSSPGVPRLGIPEFWATDGPHGVPPEVLWDEWEQAGWTSDSCTAFPALTCLAATWNPEMSLLYGRSIGEEARYRKKDILLGPGVNIYRTPLNGRNFEYMGEDPFLAARMVVPYVKGVQENGVAACVKHYALNNHEVNRHTTNVVVDERALYEIYLPAFKAAVQEGGTWSIMGSYNLFGDRHACHNDRLLNQILKRDWGFDGVVVSDWGGTHDTDEAITGGLDMEFGSWTNGLTAGASNAYDSYYLAEPYMQRLQAGEADTAILNDKVRRILRLSFRTNMNRQRPYGSLGSPEHSQAARRIAGQGIVLLKNRGGVLPIAADVRKVAVVGENAIKMMTVGGGSSSLKARYEVSPLEGLRRALDGKCEVVYARGYVGDPSGEYNGVTSGQDLSDNRTPDQLRDEAVRVAREADIVIFVGGLNKSAGQDCEDSDRASLALPYGQNELIAALAKVNPALVVVNISGNAVAMPWEKDVAAIVQGWYLGSEAGNALADVLTGAVNPSGKLPMTFPRSLDQLGAHASAESYPGVRREGSDIVDCTYSDGIFVGYRWIDRAGAKPLFPFGHGLSYTTFKYGKATAAARSLTADGTLEITVPVTNTGAVKGSETVQLYISDAKSSLPRPVKELKGFVKLDLEPGETANAVFHITPADLAFYDPAISDMKAEPGRFSARIGASSGDIRTSVDFELK